MIQIDWEMPDCCGNCPCFHFENPMYCRAIETDHHKRITVPYCPPRPDWCPLQDVPETNVGKWIPVSGRLPPERDTIFAKLKGTDKWRDAMFEKSSEDVRVVFRFEDGTRTVGHDHTIDGVWDCEKPNRYPKRTVTHWMKNPELPEEEA